MTFQDSKAVAYLADHLKSVWALSSGGIALGIGLLGFVSKDTRIPWYGYLISVAFVFFGLCLYTYSVLKGIRAHKNLVGAVLESEDPQESGGKEPTEDFNTIMNALIDLYDRSRYAFLGGTLVSGLGVLIFIVWSALLSPTVSPSSLVISVKNASVITVDSRRLEIEELSFRMTDPRLSSAEHNNVEIRDLVFKVRTLESAR